MDKIRSKRTCAKQQDGQEYTTQLLMENFRRFDENMSGSLTAEELKGALGPKHLNIGVTEHEMDLVLNEMDADNNGEISYQEFIKFLEVHDIDPSYNPFYDARQRELLVLKTLSTAPWKFEQQTHDEIDEFDKLQETRMHDLAIKEAQEAEPPRSLELPSSLPQKPAAYPNFLKTTSMEVVLFDLYSPEGFIHCHFNSTQQIVKQGDKDPVKTVLTRAKTHKTLNSSEKLFSDMQVVYVRFDYEV